MWYFCCGVMQTQTSHNRTVHRMAVCEDHRTWLIVFLVGGGGLSVTRGRKQQRARERAREGKIDYPKKLILKARWDLRATTYAGGQVGRMYCIQVASTTPGADLLLGLGNGRGKIENN